MQARVKRSLRRKVRQLLPYGFLVRRWRRTARQYVVKAHFKTLDYIPLTWWPVTANFGDAASPWLVTKMTGVETRRAAEGERNYVAIGSVMKWTSSKSIIWGTGAFGTEKKTRVQPRAKYLAVRGPLTRQLLENYKIRAPEVYGDPALLAPLYYYPKIKKRYDIGVVVRWSEKGWRGVDVGDGVT